jgi:hypothetical protein
LTSGGCLTNLPFTNTTNVGRLAERVRHGCTCTTAFFSLPNLMQLPTFDATSCIYAKAGCARARVLWRVGTNATCLAAEAGLPPKFSVRSNLNRVFGHHHTVPCLRGKYQKKSCPPSKDDTVFTSQSQPPPHRNRKAGNSRDLCVQRANRLIKQVALLGLEHPLFTACNSTFFNTL